MKRTNNIKHKTLSTSIKQTTNIKQTTKIEHTTDIEHKTNEYNIYNLLSMLILCSNDVENVC